jgi:hypothetical protein
MSPRSIFSSHQADDIPVRKDVEEKAAQTVLSLEKILGDKFGHLLDEGPQEEVGGGGGPWAGWKS